jgi:hypothetical protein
MKFLPLVFFLCCGPVSHAQFLIDTVSTVEITAKGSKPVKRFSTFNRRLFGAGTHQFVRSKSGYFPSPVAVKFINPRGRHSVRVDSVAVKSTELDTAYVRLHLALFQGGKLLKLSPAGDIQRKGKVSTFQPLENLEIPPGESYVAFWFDLKEVYPFYVYTTKSVQGYYYSYNSERDEFSLLDPGDAPTMAPQIIIYYTTLWDATDVQ